MIDRSGMLGKDNNNPNCNFSCSAGKDLVVITPNVYPCLFLAKPGYEIGKYGENTKNCIRLYYR